MNRSHARSSRNQFLEIRLRTRFWRFVSELDFGGRKKAPLLEQGFLVDYQVVGA